MLTCLLLLTLAAPTYQWRVVPIDGGGSIECLTISPHDPGLVLAGSDVGGVQRSTDGGRTWTVCNTGMRHDADVAIADLEFHPTLPKLVYAATGKCFGRPSGDWGALLVSEDAGRTWMPRSRAVRFSGMGTGRQRGDLLVTDPERPDWLWAATAWDGVMLSRDQGRSWQSLGLSDYFLTALRRGGDESLYAAAEPQQGRPGGVFRKPAGPGGWARLYDGPVRGMAIGPERILIATPDAGLILSEDDGTTWVNVTPSGFADRLRADTVELSPSHPQVGLATGVERQWQRRHPSVYVTLDGGRTWQSMVAPGQVNVNAGDWWNSTTWFGFNPHCALFDPTDPRRVWFGDWYNVWVTHDGAASWFSGHSGLRTAVVRHLALDPIDRNSVWLGLADIGVFRAEADPAAALAAGGNASPIGSVPGLACRREHDRTAVYIARGKTLWRQENRSEWKAVKGAAPADIGAMMTLPDGDLLAEVEGRQPHLSEDGGRTWHAWGTAPKSQGKPVSLGLPTAIEPGSLQAMAIGDDDGLYYTADSGVHWRRIDQDLPDIDHGGRRSKHLALVAARMGPRPLLFAASLLALWRSPDLGDTWSRILPEPVRAMAVDPQLGRLYVATSGAWYDRYPAHIRISDDDGNSFQVIDDPFPTHRLVRTILPDPRVPGRVWFGLIGNAAVVGEPVR